MTTTTRQRAKRRPTPTQIVGLHRLASRLVDSAGKPLITGLPPVSSVEIGIQLQSLHAAYTSGALNKAQYEVARRPLVEQLHDTAAQEEEALLAALGPLGVTIGTTVVVAGELIEAAWGNQVRTDLLALNAGKVEKAGDTLSGQLVQTLNPVSVNDLARKGYVDLMLPLSGGTMSGEIVSNLSGTAFCFRARNDPAAAFGAVMRNDGQMQTSVTGGGGSTVSTPNLVLGRGGAAANDTGVWVAFRSDPSSSSNPQGTLRGSITVNGSGGGAVAYNTSSDHRLKDVKGPVKDALERIGALKPVRFRWKADRKGDDLEGFLAHEVADVVPQAVSGAKDAVLPDDDEHDPGGIDPQQLDQSQLVPLLVAAVQELSAKVDDLTAQLAAAKKTK